MPQPSQSLSSALPTLIFGTATLNYQFNPDPYALHPHELIATALRSGIRAFDTSPYYGPAEGLLGDALDRYLTRQTATSTSARDSVSSSSPQLSRSDLVLLTKCGRLTGNAFDYSPDYIRFSIARSLRRLHTDYLDVVYLHDCEFVTPEQVLTGVLALRAIRDSDASIRYIGLSGYPVVLLCELAEMVYTRTGEPVDIVQSYAHFTIINQRLGTCVDRLKRAGVEVVTNASPLGMGLLRTQGVPKGMTGGQWHPAPDGLREACAEIAKWLQQEAGGEKLEIVAGRWALEEWLRVGAEVGTCVSLEQPIQSLLDTNSDTSKDRISGIDHEDARQKGSEGDVTAVATDAKATATATAGAAPTASTTHKLGVSVIGVSTLSELADTLRVYRSILDGLSSDTSADVLVHEETPTAQTTPIKPANTAATAPSSNLKGQKEESRVRRAQIQSLTRRIREEILDAEWRDFAWYSPENGFLNARGEEKEWGVREEDLRLEREEIEKRNDKS